MWLYTELGLDLPAVGERAPGPEFPFPRRYQTMVISTADPFLAIPSPDPIRQREEYFPILARFVARLREAEDESLDGATVGVEGVDPTPFITEWFEHLAADVSVRLCSRDRLMNIA